MLYNTALLTSSLIALITTVVIILISDNPRLNKLKRISLYVCATAIVVTLILTVLTAINIMNNGNTQNNQTINDNNNTTEVLQDTNNTEKETSKVTLGDLVINQSEKHNILISEDKQDDQELQDIQEETVNSKNVLRISWVDGSVTRDELIELVNYASSVKSLELNKEITFRLPTSYELYSYAGINYYYEKLQDNSLKAYVIINQDDKSDIGYIVLRHESGNLIVKEYKEINSIQGKPIYKEETTEVIETTTSSIDETENIEDDIKEDGTEILEENTYDIIESTHDIQQDYYDDVFIPEY